MIVQSPAKINLSFEITGRREDGYHYIRSEMLTIDICDYLWVERSTELTYTGPIIASHHQSLIFKAVQAMEAAVEKKLPVSVHLDKSIPIGAGMGGGSSNAAAMLYALNKLYDLDIPKPRLMEIGLTIGADVPFFVEGGRCLVEGIGEIVKPLPPDEKPMHFIIFRPHVRLDTNQAYADYDRTGKTFSELAMEKAPQLDVIFRTFKDATISGKGPTAFVQRPLLDGFFLSEMWCQATSNFDGDIWVVKTHWPGG